MNTYPESVQYLYSLGNEVKTIKLGLERVATVLHALGDPQNRFRSIHVAGTNGKGSTCAMIEAGLRAAGVRTGLYTSPHLLEPTERIKISGVQVTTDRFTEAFRVVHETATRLADNGGIDGHPTYFETVTAMGFWLMAREGVEWAVVEVGLGGRLDATNVVKPDLCVITAVDYDHEAWLGSSLEGIAGEKAGILKSEVPAVIARQRPEALKPILERGREVGAPLKLTTDFPVSELTLSSRGCRFRAGNLQVASPLAGEHQVENALAAAVALDQLGFPVSGIEQAVWRGRLERVAENPEIILDGAHNPAGVRALASYIRRFYSDRKVWLIYGAMRDKSVDEIGEALAPVASEIILTQVDSPRALRPEALMELFDHPHVRAAASLDDSLAIVRSEASPLDVVFITGSLYLVGEALGKF